MLSYRYGALTLASALPLPELIAAPDDQAAVLRIKVSAHTVIPARTWLWQHDFPTPSGATALSAMRAADGYGLRFPQVAEAWATGDGTLRLWRDPSASEASLRHVLLDQILPRLIAQRGTLVLHASAVSLQPHQVLLTMGDSGMGKSTLAGAFAASGSEVLTDDGAVISVEGTAVNAVATYPSLRLWPDSLTTLFADRLGDATPMAHYSDKRRLPMGAGEERECGQGHRVIAIAVLHPPDGDKITLSPMSPQAACMAVVRNTFQLDLSDRGNIQHLLAQAAEVTRRVPVLALRYPRDYARLPEVMAALRGLGPPSGLT